MKQKIRKHIYCAVEGEGEQAFIRWLQILSDQAQLFITLDTEVLAGGGYGPMLHAAIKASSKRNRNDAKHKILLLDADRGQQQEDGWTLTKLKQQAEGEGFQVCIQDPNQEGLLLRLFEGEESRRPDAKTARQRLHKKWPAYQKPVSAQRLSSRFTLADVQRAAQKDTDLQQLLMVVGLWVALE